MSVDESSPNKRNRQQLEEELAALDDEGNDELDNVVDSSDQDTADGDDVEELADEQAAKLRRQKIEEPNVVEKADEVAESLANELNLSEDQEDRLAQKIAEKIISSKEQDREQIKKRTTQVRKRDRAPKSDHWSNKNLFGRKNA